MKKLFTTNTGFTVIEMAVVISVISVLIAIATLQFMSYRDWSCNVAAKDELRMAYKAAYIFFLDHPNDTLTSETLGQYGYAPSKNVQLRIDDGTLGNFSMITYYNMAGAEIFAVDKNGNIRSAGNMPSPGGKTGGSRPNLSSPGELTINNHPISEGQQEFTSHVTPQNQQS
jgi:prepilin-type N-terminal cleavage/methylation domain-containing protein